MKKLFLLLLMTFLIFACDMSVKKTVDYEEPPVIEEPEEPEADDYRLIYEWMYNNGAWTFTLEGDYSYYNYLTGELYSVGTYTAVDGEICLIENDTEVTVTYIYQILYDEPDFGEVSLRWYPEGNPGATVDYLRMDE